MLAGPLVWSAEPLKSKLSFSPRFSTDDMDAHRLVQIDAVVVDEAFRLEPPIRSIRAIAAVRIRFAIIPAAGRSRRATLSLPNFAISSLSALLAQPVGAELAADVAEHELRRTAVGGDEALDVAVAPVARADSAPPAGAGPR